MEAYCARIMKLAYVLIITGTLFAWHWEPAAAATCNSQNNGFWNDSATWDCGVIPAWGDVVSIGHIITLDVDPVAGLNGITVATGGVLETSSVRDLNNNSLTIEGTFRFSSDTAFVSNGTFTYGANGTLEFTHGTGTSFTVNNTDVYWPAANGPVNVTVSQKGTLDLNSITRTINGVFRTNGNVLNPSNLTITGTLRLTDVMGTFSAPPIYADNSTLRYASPTGYNRSNEWGTSGDSRPFHVRISNGTTFTLAGADTTTPREMRGNLTIDAGSNTFSIGFLNADFTVNGNVDIEGTLILSSGSGNMRVGGNWTRQASGTFQSLMRWVYFQGGTTQMMSGMMTGINRFERILVVKNPTTLASSTVSFISDVGVISGLVVEPMSTFQTNGTANFIQAVSTVTTFPPQDILDCDGTCIFNNLTLLEMDAGGSTGAIDVNGNFTLSSPGTDFIAPGPGASFTVAGNFISNITTGSFSANGGTITFDAGGTQNLDADSSLMFENIVVSSNTTLVELIAATDATATSVTNNGIIRKTRDITASGLLSFGLTDVDLNVNSFAGTPSIQVDRMDSDHPSATPGIGSTSQKFWDITTTGSGTFDVNVTFTDSTMSAGWLQRTCRTDDGGTNWQCQNDDDGNNANNSTTRNNVTAFSGWQNCVACGPTSIMLVSFTARREWGTGPLFLILTGALALALLSQLGFHRFYLLEKR